MKRVLLAAILLTAVSALSLAADLTLDQIMARMEEADKNINSIEFDFKQEICYTLTNEKQVNSGRVSFLKPDNIRVKQRTPLEQEITANGRKVWIYTPKYRQVVADSWKKWISNSFVPASIINFGKGYKDLMKRYKISYEGKDAADYVLLFTPAGEESFKMKFWIDGQSFVPSKLTITGENVTIQTEMINKVLNPKLDKKSFSFQPPSGVEVMDLP